MLFNIDNVQAFIESLKEKIQVNYLHIRYSTLGGKDNLSILITISKDKKENWSNNILQNTKYAMFHLSNNGKIELFSKQYIMPKFRKCTIKNIDHLIEKINAYIQL